MKVLLCVHGFPPELQGGTERATRALAEGLAEAGDEVLVLAGSLEGSGAFALSEAEPRTSERGASLRLLHARRGDLYFDHWQKSEHPAVERALRKLLAEERVELVHVCHWLRLSDGLVLAAARAGVPALLWLHDHSIDCLLGLRVDPRSHRPCEQATSMRACVACAAHHPPRTPWLALDQQWLRFEKRRERLARELRLARARIVPSASHAASIERYLGLAPGALDCTVVPPPRRERLARREALPEPGLLGCLRLGTIGHSSPVKGLALVREAVARVAEREPVELRAAGSLVGEAYEASALSSAPVSEVHALVSGSLAPESYGYFLDEARELGLPAVLPRSGAFVERAVEGEGVLFYEPGSVESLASVLLSLAREQGLLARLRARIPHSGESFAEGIERLRALGQAARAAGPPPAAELPREEWFAARMTETEIACWDDALARTPPQALGLESAPDEREPR